MSQQLPLFPLQLVVFPGEELRLHIFEARYRQLVSECETENIEFGIPAYIDGKMMSIGTSVRLLKVDKNYSTGESDITVVGTSLFQIDEFFEQLPNKLYAGALVQAVALTGKEDPIINNEILQLTEQLFRLLNVSKSLPDNTNPFITYELAHLVGFSLDQEYELLCLTGAQERQRMLLSYLKELLPTVQKVEALRHKAMLNGAHKNIIPPKV